MSMVKKLSQVGEKTTIFWDFSKNVLYEKKTIFKYHLFTF